MVTFSLKMKNHVDPLIGKGLPRDQVYCMSKGMDENLTYESSSCNSIILTEDPNIII